MLFETFFAAYRLLHTPSGWCSVAEYYWCSVAANPWCTFSRELTNGFDFDIFAFLSAGKDNAAVVIFLVLVLTYLAGRFGAKGRVQLGLSLALGFLLGSTFQAAAVGWPVIYAGWFWLVIYALVMAVLPFLVYDLGKDLVEKTLRKSDVAAETAQKVSEAFGNQPVGRG